MSTASERLLDTIAADYPEAPRALAILQHAQVAEIAAFGASHPEEAATQGAAVHAVAAAFENEYGMPLLPLVRSFERLGHFCATHPQHVPGEEVESILVERAVHLLGFLDGMREAREHLDSVRLPERVLRSFDGDEFSSPSTDPHLTMNDATDDRVGDHLLPAYQFGAALGRSRGVLEATAPTFVAAMDKMADAAVAIGGLEGLNLLEQMMGTPRPAENEEGAFGEQTNLERTAVVGVFRGLRREHALAQLGRGRLIRELQQGRGRGTLDARTLARVLRLFEAQAKPVSDGGSPDPGERELAKAAAAETVVLLSALSAKADDLAQLRAYDGYGALDVHFEASGSTAELYVSVMRRRDGYVGTAVPLIELRTPPMESIGQASDDDALVRVRNRFDVERYADAVELASVAETPWSDGASRGAHLVAVVRAVAGALPPQAAVLTGSAAYAAARIRRGAHVALEDPAAMVLALSDTEPALESPLELDYESREWWAAFRRSLRSEFAAVAAVTVAPPEGGSDYRFAAEMRLTERGRILFVREAFRWAAGYRADARSAESDQERADLIARAILLEAAARRRSVRHAAESIRGRISVSDPPTDAELRLASETVAGYLATMLRGALDDEYAAFGWVLAESLVTAGIAVLVEAFVRASDASGD